jgi:CIC family chloride channel protein
MPLRLVSLTFQRLPRQGRAIVRACLYGLGGGGAAVAFQLSLNWVYEAGLVRLSHQSLSMFLVGSAAIMLGASLLVGWLLHAVCPEAAGSGIPQLKFAYWKASGWIPFRVVWVKFLAGVASIGSGTSLGREGPSVQLAGAVASTIAGGTGEAADNRRVAAAAGAAAGLAAAFNTPLAATTFVLEEIIGDLNSRLLGSVLLAAVLGALVVHGIIGKQPAFALPATDAPSLNCYALTPLAAALAAMVGVYFQRSSLALRARTKSYRRVPRWSLPAIGALGAWVLGAAVFWRTGHLGVFSLGYGDLSSALAGDLGWRLAVALLVAKFLATTLCYGFGGCGGIFSPTLFLGGMVGLALAGVAGLEMHLSSADSLTLTVVGMSACLGTVVGAPVTGILIVFEMTHEFALVPALMVGALISQTIGRKMNRQNFYDALLTQDGHHLDQLRPPRDLSSWQQLPITAVANRQPVVLTGVDASGIRKAMEAHAFRRFPVVTGGACVGILARAEAESALEAQRPPALEPVVACLDSQTITDVQQLMIETGSHFIVTIDRPQGAITGIVTINDLLRAQAEADNSSDDLTTID